MNEWGQTCCAVEGVSVVCLMLLKMLRCGSLQRDVMYCNVLYSGQL
jgi:hypothetical protein